MTKHEKPKRCHTCNRILVLGDTPDRCTMCLADDWAKKHHARYVRRFLGYNRAQRRLLAKQLRNERTRAL